MRKSKWTGFRSPLAEPINAYLKYKRALCKKYVTQEQSLRVFDAYLVETGLTTIDEITTQVVDKFFANRPPSRPNTHNQLIGSLRRLFQWMLSQGMLSESPLRSTRKRRATEELKPYIFSSDEVKRLLVMSGQLRNTTSNARGRASKYRMIFTLAYGLGLRVGEISALRVGDVDVKQAVLTIKQSKFGKTRLVPMGPKLAHQLSEFLDEFCSQDNSDPVFSILGDKRAMSRTTITVVFHQLVLKMGLQPSGGERSPRLHDLRHSFAVNTFLRLYREGKDPSQQLLQLSTFLGHSKLQHTTVYLSMTDELLNEANSRFYKFAAATLQEVAP
ncbi:MAG: tyrosine-type recombinase/integrase [Candidatus Obscuribacterales bacterium]|nr:tyrosine-type recombinase/integrase [Candidatus Obscuribacterales bacterium]